jgi:hypothetical protein
MSAGQSYQKLGDPFKVKIELLTRNANGPIKKGLVPSQRWIIRAGMALTLIMSSATFTYLNNTPTHCAPMSIVITRVSRE